MRVLLFACAVSIAVGACAGGARADTSTSKLAKSKRRHAVRVGHKERGKATWYGGKWHGRKTASGERFNKNAFTAAHKSLPFGTVVRVSNLRNSRTVNVRITDRGPYGKGRIIDVSEAAARKLRMLNAGVVPVTIEVLKVGKGRRRHKRRKQRS